MTDFAIDINNVSKSYNGLQVLREVSLQIKKGEFYILMGPNGSGKSTLLSIIAGTNVFESGQVRLFGHDIVEDAREARQHIGYVPQQNYCSAFLTGRENLQYFARLLGLTGPETTQLINTLLSTMGLSDAADRRVAEYSGGMRKKLEVAAALLTSPDILLLDEPSTGLDPRIRKDFLELLSEINRQGTTILLVTHIGEDAETGTRVGFMIDGEIVVEDCPESLKEQSGVHDSIIIDASPRDDQLPLLLATLDENCIVVEHEEGFMISCEDVMNLVPRIVELLNANGYTLLRVNTSPPTLEDVFYRLTAVQIRSEA